MAMILINNQYFLQASQLAHDIQVFYILSSIIILTIYRVYRTLLLNKLDCCIALELPSLKARMCSKTKRCTYGPLIGCCIGRGMEQIVWPKKYANVCHWGLPKDFWGHFGSISGKTNILQAFLQYLYFWPQKYADFGGQKICL